MTKLISDELQGKWIRGADERKQAFAMPLVLEDI